VAAPVWNEDVKKAGKETSQRRKRKTTDKDQKPSKIQHKARYSAFGNVRKLDRKIPTTGTYGRAMENGNLRIPGSL